MIFINMCIICLLYYYCVCNVKIDYVLEIQAYVQVHMGLTIIVDKLQFGQLTAFSQLSLHCENNRFFGTGFTIYVFTGTRTVQQLIRYYKSSSSVGTTGQARTYDKR